MKQPRKSMRKADKSWRQPYKSMRQPHKSLSTHPYKIIGTKMKYFASESTKTNDSQSKILKMSHDSPIGQSSFRKMNKYYYSKTCFNS